MKKLLSSVAYARTKDQGVGKCCTNGKEKKTVWSKVLINYLQGLGGKKYKREHYELCTYNYSDSCEMILLGDTDKELMMDIKDLF